MRLLLDESVPRRLRRYLPAHEVRTVVDGALLALAACDFDAVLTVEKTLPYQRNLQTLPVAVVLLNAVSNELSVLLQLLPRLEEALSRLQPGSYVQVIARATSSDKLT